MSQLVSKSWEVGERGIKSWGEGEEFGRRGGGVGERVSRGEGVGVGEGSWRVETGSRG